MVLSFNRYFTSVSIDHTLPFSAVGTIIKSRKYVTEFTKCLKKEESEFLTTSSGVGALQDG